MAERRPNPGAAGFSLVELLIALVFVLFLMGGMSMVFKATITTFNATGEKLSSSRRNLMATEVLYDDVNNAGMYLMNLTNPPGYTTANQALFEIDPASSTNPAPAGADQGADTLTFYLDDPLPFEGNLYSTSARSASTLANLGLAPSAQDFTYVIDCGSASYATQVVPGMGFIFKDSWESANIASVSLSGQYATVVVGAATNSGITGSGYAGLPSKFTHITHVGTTPGCGIVFVNPGQLVRYSLVPMNLDPRNSTAATVCLVRDEGPYQTSGWAPTAPRQIITENVAGFRVYLSADSGTTWVGSGSGYATWAAIQTAINTQLATVGRPGFQTITADPSWFRTTPLLVRLDITTRTANQRTEFSTTGNTLAYKEQVQSLVMVPRHFGLTLN